ncbi:hypothetical protein D1872_309320 [compost metagenome]
MRQIVFTQHLYDFQQCGNARFVVGAEDRRAVAADIAVVSDDRFDPFPGNDRIHMTGEQERANLGRGRIARLQGSHQISGRMAGAGRRIILDDR